MWEQPVPESGPTSGGCRGHETTSDPSPVLGSVWCPVSVCTLPGLWCWTFQWVFFLQKGVRALAGTSLPGEGGLPSLLLAAAACFLPNLCRSWAAFRRVMLGHRGRGQARAWWCLLPETTST